MKSSILISRISRVLETEGAVGEGSNLAEEYSVAVQGVNQRLESVQTAIDGKQVSEAVRLMEANPRLLDEVSTLDFNQLPDWEVLCARKNWTAPVKIDKSLLERVLLLNESTEAVEPFLRMYRKAVRTNDNKLAVQSLRRLVAIDHSQNWKVNLLQAEEIVQKKMIEDFRVAKAAGNKADMDRLSQELLDTPWSETPASKGVDEIRAYIAEEEAKRRNQEGAENIEILKRCADGEWNRTLVFSIIQAIDRLCERGWSLPNDNIATVAACRKRCADEMELEEKEARWKELCEQLHTAIQQENTAAIRDVLSAPEFFEKEPPADLIKQAQLVIAHEEAAKKRKMVQIATCIIFGLVSILGVSGWWLQQKLFDDRCEGEAVKLAALESGKHAVDRLTEALDRLKNDSPEVYADPRVNIFEGKLKTMRSSMIARTNELRTLIGELQVLRDEKWGDDVASVTGRLDRINSLLTKDDDQFRADFIKIKAAWGDHCDEIAEQNRNAATKFHESLVAHVNMIVGRLTTELMSNALEKDVNACKESMDEWRRIHSQHAPTLEGVVGEAEKSLADAENTQQNLQKAIKKLKSAQTVSEYLDSRKALVDYYSTYPFVGVIGNHPISSDDATAVTSKESGEWETFEKIIKFGIDKEAFKTFLEENVVGLSDISSYYSLYGIYLNNNPNYFAVAKGKPQIKSPSYDDKCQIDGEILSLRTCEMHSQISDRVKVSEVKCESLPQSEEIKTVVDIASRANITIESFEQEILKLLREHLAKGGSATYFKEENETYREDTKLKQGRYPAIRRVQLIYMYLTWLKEDLKIMPQDPRLSHWFDQVERLAQNVRVDNVPDELTWLCMKEQRVRQRNAECARLLHDMASRKFIDVYRNAKKIRSNLLRVKSWSVEFAGSVAYDPYDARWMKDHSLVIPYVIEGVEKNRPLFVIRRENGKLVLRKALVPYKNGTCWIMASGMSKDIFVSGDPLVQISEKGKYIDPEEELAKIFSELPEYMVKLYSEAIPFYSVKAR